jgi:hypothetical protein
MTYLQKNVGGRGSSLSSSVGCERNVDSTSEAEGRIKKKVFRKHDCALCGIKNIYNP